MSTILEYCRLAATLVAPWLVLACSSGPVESPDAAGDRLPDRLRCVHPILDSCATRQRSYAKLPSQETDERTDFEDAESVPQGRDRFGTAIAGQMTPRAAQAKKLFDKERWPEAIVAMEAVANGDYEDDAGNRELGDYYLAIALYRVHDYEAAIDLFTQIGQHKRHLKYKESLLWISKLVSQVCPHRKLLRVLTLSDERRNSSDWSSRSTRQAPLYYTIVFAQARGFADVGRDRDAVYGFARVMQYPPMRKDAEECLSLLYPDWRQRYSHKRTPFGANAEAAQPETL
ncbi:MAG: hypothetical protein R3B07_36890 [Polyangiaceae bacterium]